TRIAFGELGRFLSRAVYTGIPNQRVAPKRSLFAKLIHQRLACFQELSLIDNVTYLRISTILLQRTGDKFEDEFVRRIRGRCALSQRDNIGNRGRRWPKHPDSFTALALRNTGLIGWFIQLQGMDLML